MNPQVEISRAEAAVKAVADRPPLPYEGIPIWGRIALANEAR